MSASIYVYYKIDPDRRGRAKVVIEAMLAEVAAQASVRARLLRRDNDPVTWLEVYEPVSDFEGLVSALDAATKRHGFAEFLQHGSSRVLERFVPLD